ncbi:hypothetical protein AAFF_G00099420 [Aldrovandia affinis]|uniref:Uncharacterized protein n=1 Tax=Aldrovandia affinis TaxID=143900 RepID=A0AAD7WBS9_9TELE|nr:hypothetical protein AAFF_G00099420 [Aldrovandia affinis]
MASMKCLSPASSAEGVKVESVMDSTDGTGVELRSSLNRSEGTEERKECKTGYGMSSGEKYILSNVKEEEEWERWSVKDEERLWMEQEKKERDEQGLGDAGDQTFQTGSGEKNGIKSECWQQEGVEVSSLVTAFLLKQPRVLIRRLQITDISVFVPAPPCSISSKTGPRVRSPWRQHELSPVRGKRQKDQVVTQKRKMIGELERPLKWLPASSQSGISAEASCSSSVVTPRNQNTGQIVEALHQAFACSQSPFVHTEEHSRIQSPAATVALACCPA